MCRYLHHGVLPRARAGDAGAADSAGPVLYSRPRVCGCCFSRFLRNRASRLAPARVWVLRISGFADICKGSSRLRACAIRLESDSGVVLQKFRLAPCARVLPNFVTALLLCSTVSPRACARVLSSSICFYRVIVSNFVYPPPPVSRPFACGYGAVCCWRMCSDLMPPMRSLVPPACAYTLAPGLHRWPAAGPIIADPG
jgi:hypothetical protein